VQKLSEELDFTDWELSRYEKTGVLRWPNIMRWHSLGAVKAGFLKKKNGVWYLTPEGEAAIKLGPEKMLESFDAEYRKWSSARVKESADSSGEEDLSSITNIEDIKSQALETFQKHLRTIDAYDFQYMVSELLKAMGYHISYVAPPGKDDGVDVIAYQDPLGTKTPKIKVQVKHKPDTSIPPSDIRSLVGVLKESDVGLFVTSGKYSTEAARFARQSSKHVELIDFKRFISLWQEFYNSLTQEGRAYMPLQRISFVDQGE